MNKCFISIVLPIYNESDNLSLFYSELCKAVVHLEDRYDFEMIMINDGSIDNSWQKIRSLAQSDQRIKAICLSRNFGHQVALTVGYDIAAGQAIISMDTDLQHPPELIATLLDEWRKGTPIIYVRNSERVHSWLKKKLSDWFYIILDCIASVKIPRNVQDFRLIDKKVLDVIKATKEKSRYLRGIVAWTGFNYVIVEVPYLKRMSGTSGYSWGKMWKLAFDGITGFSLFPLKIASYVGIFTIVTGTLMFFYITIDALFFQVRYPLFKWLVTIIYIFIGIVFLLLWLIGEYIGRIYQELQGRPMYVVSDHLNLGKNEYHTLFRRSHATCNNCDISVGF